MTDGNQNPLWEREWTIGEMEEFFSSPDAVTGLLSGAVASNASWSNAPKPTGIHVTSIVPPEVGWPIMAHCSICRETVIVLSPYAAKPEDGDIWSLKGTCLDEDEHIRHNLYPQHDYPWPIRKEPFQFQPLDPLPPPLYPSWVEFEQELPIEEAKKRYPQEFEREK